MVDLEQRHWSCYAKGFLHITEELKNNTNGNGRYVVPSSIETNINKSSFVDNCILYGDNKPFNIAVVDPNKDEILDWAKAENLDFSEYKELLARPELRNKIELDIKKLLCAIL